MTDKDYSAKKRLIEDVFGRDLFFLCGVLKSGTTWLERLLDHHPDVICKGEAHFGSDLLRLISDSLDEYNELMPKHAGAIAHLKEFGGHTDVLEYDSSDVDYLVTTAIGLMLGKWLAGTDAKCIGEKTPDNLRFISTLNRYFPQAKFIHIVRDGRDVAVSLWNFNLNTDIGKTIKEWGTFRNFAPEIGRMWADDVRKGRESGRILGDLYREIRYEDLVANPLEHATEVFGFLGVNDKPEIVKECIDGASFENLSGGRKPGDEDSESFYRKGIAGDWRNHFDEATVNAFNDVAGDVLEEFGYT